MKIAVLVCFCLVCASFWINERRRAEINVLLGPSGIEVPEHRPTGYTRDDLENFKTTAAAASLSDGHTVLDGYIRPVLIPNDIVFALALGAFVALLGFALAQSFQTLRVVFMASAVFGLVYAACDVGEDLMLVKLLSAPTMNNRDVMISSLLTRIKIYTLIASVSGGLVFKGLKTTYGALTDKHDNG